MKTANELRDDFNAACTRIVHALAMLDRARGLKLKERRELREANNEAGKALKAWEEANEDRA